MGIDARPESLRQAYRIVSALSLPWSDFAPEATLTETQIEDSHNIDSVRFRQMLETNDPKLHSLIAWWPFLCVVVVVYGLLIRGALLLAFAAIQWRRSPGQAAIRSCGRQCALAAAGRAVGHRFRRKPDPVRCAVGDPGSSGVESSTRRGRALS